MMHTYIIIYDLIKVRDYRPLHEAIRSYSGWAHINESTWAVATSDSAVEIRDHLSKFLDSDDHVFVVRARGDAAWQNCPDEISEWLMANLPIEDITLV